MTHYAYNMLIQFIGGVSVSVREGMNEGVIICVMKGVKEGVMSGVMEGVL